MKVHQWPLDDSSLPTAYRTMKGRYPNSADVDQPWRAGDEDPVGDLHVGAAHDRSVHPAEGRVLQLDSVGRPRLFEQSHDPDDHQHPRVVVDDGWAVEEGVEPPEPEIRVTQAAGETRRSEP